MALYLEFLVSDFFIPHLGKKTEAFTSGEYRVISGTTVENGVIGYSDNFDKLPTFENIITISNRGEYSGTAYFQPHKFILSNNVIALEPNLKVKKHFSKRINIFFTTVLNKLPYGGYGNYPTKSGILNDILSLPVKSLSDTEPDWEYMEQYIKEIEKKALLQVKQQNDLEIERLRGLVGDIQSPHVINDIEYRGFTIGSVLDISSSKAAIHKNMLSEFNGEYPYVTRTNLNNGIDSYIAYDEKLLNPENTISLGLDTYVFNYQNKPYFTGNKVKVLSSNNLNKFTAVFLVTALTKAFQGYSWGTGINTSQIQDMKLMLPINKELSDLVPDWNTMEQYIKGIQQKYELLKEQQNVEQLQNLLLVTGLTEEELISDNEKKLLDHLLQKMIAWDYMVNVIALMELNARLRLENNL